MKKIIRYQEKQRQGLVPTTYDRDSERFKRGAWRHWPSDRHSPAARRLESIDRRTLYMARGRKGRVS